MKALQLHPLRKDGTIVDATFDLEAIDVFDVVYRHKAGARGGARSVNADYHEGLELVLHRLGTVGATILGISVDSAVARRLEPEQRELDLPFPIEVVPSTDPLELRKVITRAQKPVARRTDAARTGGNDQKTIRMTIAPHEPDVDFDELRNLLVRGALDRGSDQGGENARSSASTVTKHELQGWVVEALRALGGSGTVVVVASEIWAQHEADLRAAGDLFFTWQYDMRWAAQALRDQGRARNASDTRRGLWELA